LFHDDGLKAVVLVLVVPDVRDKEANLFFVPAISPLVGWYEEATGDVPDQFEAELRLL
jgi:hypothetical protein